MDKTKSSIEIDLNDPRAGKIADALSNKTAKKILNYLTDKEEMSGSEIAAELNLPLNTVTYNLKTLTDAGLIEKANRLFWSSKGKKMELYKLSNKKIIISPRIASRSIIAGIVGVLAVVIVALLIASNQQGIEKINIVGDDKLNKFNSIEEIKSFLEENSGSYGGYYGRGAEIRAAVASDSATAKAESAAPSASGTGERAGDYSKTNIQVEGGDEPDIVKNDGKYIYVVTGNKVIVLDAFPAEDMEIISELEFKDGVRNIFINKDKLIIFTNHYEYIDSGIPCRTERFAIGLRCGGYSKQETIVNVYDTSDRKDPKLEDEIKIEGNFVDARMIEENVYLISQKWINLNWFGMPRYEINGIEKVVDARQVNYIDAPDENYVFNFITSINLEDGEVNNEVYLMGSSNVIYVSQDNIYISYMKQLSQKYYLEKYVEKVVLPILPNEESEEVIEVMDSDGKIWEKSNEINEILEDYLFSDGEEIINEVMEYEELLEDFYEEMSRESEKTIIHKIGIDDGEIDYEIRGEIPGNVLNQFSMDEFEGYFRVVATTGNSWSGTSFNHLYVLDEDLKIVGSVEDLAKGERIYSARFLGERAYMVTFRQVDPLFAIDLSDPENPKVLGELKITGYSGYLHPYDEDHLIGIGMEATEQGRVQGVKVSLFDVSNAGDPKEVDTFEMTDGKWSNSQAVGDPKAVLFDREKNVLVIPVNYNEEIKDPRYQWPRYKYWQGVYVFDIDLEGIDLRGKISHQEDENNYGGYVRRSLFIADVLYTVSDRKVKANDLNSVEEIREVKLGFEEDYYQYGGGIAVDGEIAEAIIN